MKLYKIQRVQELPISLQEAWDFFSDPGNLEGITPKKLQFKILSDLPRKMYEGMLINYEIKPLLNFTVNWTTEITNVAELEYFIDEQRFGPYKMWHHEHRFTAIPEGVRMEDTVHYAMPIGFLGAIAHGLWVQRDLNLIFDHRFKKLQELFSNKSENALGAA